MHIDHDRGVRASALVDIDLLDLGRAIGNTLGFAEHLQRKLVTLAAPGGDVLLVEGIDGLVIRLVELVLVHIEPNAWPFYVRRLRRRSLRQRAAGENRRPRRADDLERGSSRQSAVHGRIQFAHR